MLFLTHILLGLLFFLVFKIYLMGNIFVMVFLVLLGSIFPDIDEPSSKMSRWSGFIGRVVVTLSKHRGFFHSIFLYVLIGGVISYFFSWVYGAAFLLGYLAHLIGDCMTKMGVAPLYPLSDERFCGPVRVGGWLEYVVLCVVWVLVLVVGWWRWR